MMKDEKSVHGMWASRWVFILAAAGSAVGLGNIWRFPYITGEYGGGAFVVLYLFCIAIVGLPIMTAEVMLGRRGGMSPIHSMKKVAQQSKVTQRWAGIGVLGALSGFLILSFYSAVGSWALHYVWRAAQGSFEGITAAQSQGQFEQMQASPWLMLGYHTLFMVITMGVVARGVNAGLEKAVRFLMPVLFVLLLVLVGYSVTTPGFNEAMGFLFAFDFSKITGEAVMVALGQAFFTLSLGMGAIMAYSAYMPRQARGKDGRSKPVSIVSTVAIIALLDTLVALGAGVAMFPLVFSGGLEVSQGPGMMFVTLPLAFGHIAGGTLFGSLFFVLVVCAAWSSSISLGEPVVAWLVERGMSRVKGALLVGGGAWLLGVGSVLSFNLLSDYTFFMGTFFDNVEFLSTSVMLPLGGVLIAIFAGWVMKETQARKELAMKNFKLYMIWRALVRIFAPLAVIAFFVFSMWSTFKEPAEEPEQSQPPAAEVAPAEASAPAPQDDDKPASPAATNKDNNGVQSPAPQASPEGGSNG